jgi:hypothetical protein
MKTYEMNNAEMISSEMIVCRNELVRVDICRVDFAELKRSLFFLHRSPDANATELEWHRVSSGVPSQPRKKLHICKEWCRETNPIT